MILSCMITDDEPMARKGLQGYVEKIPFLRLAGVFEDALQLTQALAENKPDLLFLDIEMPDLTGIEFLKSTPSAPKVILTTAYEQFALQGYELDVLDYLVKPISFERFLKAANKALDYFAAHKEAMPEHIFVKADGRIEKVMLRDILYIESLQNYIAIYTRNKKVITHSTLKSIQETLPEHFIQTHKSFIVNMHEVQSIEGNILHIGSWQVPVSKLQREAILEKIIKNNLLNKQ